MSVENRFIAGGSGAVGATSGGKTTAVNNLGTASVQVIAANPSRMKITFHNPGTVDVLVAMAKNAAGAALAPTFSARGGGFLIYANGGEKSFDGECQLAWVAVAASGSGNPLTIVESNT